MKNITFLVVPIFALLLISSCTSVRVLSDYDREANFNNFKTYAFYKTGIDKAQISDLDKKRILKAIDSEMSSRGFVKANDPDILLSIFTKERQQVDVYSNYWGGGYYGWGWNPYFWGGPYNGSNVSTRTEGSLYIDVIDAKNKELVWQGRGIGTLHNIKNIEKKEARIKEFVAEILQAYPPGSESK
ncbi:hypothetical protein KCTC52924_01893 [Arenibacter antarcticus]|uniref:DUF4136 domain-containing protein n=1 Tax=Arenibacter antarcticus TaxID=2040469 RepID=A0ABW5VL81_9FLAO|nr:DUF4136 domain-containing protein [Arenibacter sp. H213]MCM4167036.1 DUF4136 domain-containing protein [Arenibacter sp. H213]